MTNIEAAIPNKKAVNINTASVEILRDQVVGIGQVLAERIVAHREARGPFANLSELTAVSGIGPIFLARIADQISVQDDPEGWKASEPGVLEPEDEAFAGGEPWEEADQQTPSEERLDIEPVNEQIERAEEMEEEQEIVSGDEQTPVGEAQASGETERLEEEQAVEVAPAEEEEEPVEVESIIEPVAPSEEAVEEQPIEEEEPPASQVLPEAVQPSRRRTFWSSLLLVLLGGLLGVVLTLVVAIIWSGTVDFAPRSQVDALARNLDTMHSNQELAWERIDELTLRADGLARKVERLEALNERVGALEQELANTQRELEGAQSEIAGTKTDLDKLAKALGDMRDEVAKSLGELGQRMDVAEDSLNELGQRMDVAEDSLSELNKSFTKLEQAFQAVESRVKRFDAFFVSLRDLLIDMEGMPASPAATKAEKGHKVVPSPTPKPANK